VNLTPTLVAIDAVQRSFEFPKRAHESLARKNLLEASYGLSFSIQDLRENVFDHELRFVSRTSISSFDGSSAVDATSKARPHDADLANAGEMQRQRH
jgi:hypothetical protein